MCVYMHTHTVTYFSVTPDSELVIPTTSCVLVSDTWDTCTVAPMSKWKGNVCIHTHRDILRNRPRDSKPNNILRSCLWHLRHMYISTYASLYIFTHRDILRSPLRVSKNNNILGSCLWHLRHMYTSTYAHMEGQCVYTCTHTPWHTSRPNPS